MSFSSRRSLRGSFSPPPTSEFPSSSSPNNNRRLALYYHVFRVSLPFVCFYCLVVTIYHAHRIAVDSVERAFQIVPR